MSGRRKKTTRHGGAGSYPRLVYNGSEEEGTNSYIAQILEHIPILKERYKPPPVWGANGHIQTAVFSVLVDRPGLDRNVIECVRHYALLPDGTRISFDIFQPAGDPTLPIDVTIAACPGLANSSENTYMRAFAIHASLSGYRVSVLNHLGVLEGEELTTPRLFTLGSTEEYGAMVRAVLKSYPSTKLVAVGFSLGANIVCKYLGEDVANQKPFLCCVSLCQGYDFFEMKETMNTWAKMKKFYAKQLTNKVRATVVKNWDYIKGKVSISEGEDNSKSPKSSEFAPRTHSKLPSKSKDLGLKKVLKCQIMIDLDELVTIKLTGHASADDYYRQSSSCHYLESIDIPTLYLNSKDDPLFVKSLHRHPENRAKNHRKALFVLTTHGGHLGFYTKTGRSFVDPFTWAERVTVEYVTAVVSISMGSQNDEDPEQKIHDKQQAYPALISSPMHRTSSCNTNLTLEDVNANSTKSRTGQPHHDYYNIPPSWSTGVLELDTIEDDSKESSMVNDQQPIRRSHTLCYFESTV